MRQALNKTFKLFLILFLSLSLFSCKNRSYIHKFDFLKELALQTGICTSNEEGDILDSLKEFEVIDAIDRSTLDENLTYSFMLDSLRVFESEINLNLNYKDDDYVYRDDALKSIEKLLDIINNKTFDTEEKHVYKDNVKDNINDAEVGDIYFDESSNSYKKINSNGEVEDAQFEEVFDELEVSSSEELNFEDCEIIDDELAIEESVYEDDDYTLLSSKTKVVNKDGYRISYKVVSGVIQFRVSNNKDNYNKYVDFKLSNIKPSYKWKYKDKTVEEAYFKLNYNLSCEVGVSKEKRNYYTIDAKNMDTSSILSAVSSSFKRKTKDSDTKIHICTIRTPIPAFPLVSLDVDLFLRISITGKIDVVAIMSNTHGFEIINGKFRLINDCKKDIDFNIEASARAVAGVNFAISAAKFSLMDIEAAAGVKAACKTTLHAFDDEGNMESKTSDLVYSDVNDISDDKIKICADVSLNWVLDLDFNTSKTLLYKLGLSRSKEILNSKDQILGNMTHIENGHFVKACTRKAKNYSTQTTNDIDVNKIVLEKYSQVININETLTLPIKALPSGYSNSDLIITSNDSSIVSVSGLNLYAKKVGSTKINIETSDHKYSAYINILVSTGK